MLQRLRTLLRRKRNAAHWGVRYGRRLTFRAPDNLRLFGRTHELHFPPEELALSTFIELFLDDCYGCRDLKRNGKNIRTVLDIGGNIGLSGIVARDAFPEAVIHTYEPNRELEPYLAAQSKIANSTYHLEAVGEKDGKISLEIRGDSQLTRSIPDQPGKVPQVGFAKAVERLGGKVDLVKMDCEGAEWEILKDRDAWQKVGHLTMEYHLFDPGRTEEATKALVTGLGFRITSFGPTKTKNRAGLLTATRRAP